jgi:hypothetical protein
VHIRRALLLFAIVLGMAALVASFSRPPENRTPTEQSEETGPGVGTAPEAAPETATPAPVDTPSRPISFDAGSPDRRRLEQGRAATLEIAVDEPGSVEVPDLGLVSNADEHTPARFEVFPTRAGSYAILFRPADGDESRPAGTLVVTAEE